MQFLHRLAVNPLLAGFAHREIGVVDGACRRRASCSTVCMEETTKTGEAWRDEWCQTCRGNRQHSKEADGTWACVYCHTPADPFAARRLDGAESNQRKQSVVADAR